LTSSRFSFSSFLAMSMAAQSPRLELSLPLVTAQIGQTRDFGDVVTARCAISALLDGSSGAAPTRGVPFSGSVDQTIASCASQNADQSLIVWVSQALLGSPPVFATLSAASNFFPFSTRLKSPGLNHTATIRESVAFPVSPPVFATLSAVSDLLWFSTRLKSPGLKHTATIRGSVAFPDSPPFFATDSAASQLPPFSSRMKSPVLECSATMAASASFAPSERPIAPVSGSPGDGASTGVPSSTVGLIVGVACAALVALLIVVFVVVRRRRSANSYDYSARTPPGQAEMSSSCPVTLTDMFSETVTLTVVESMIGRSFEANPFETRIT
jgi:hypothetical protein